jgi:beta-ureidopropionase / N-carbamoyl-L-amino-acid hydrolase
MPVAPFRLNMRSSRADETPKIDAQRLWARLMAMAEIGRRGESGVDRAAFSAEDRSARRLIYEWGREIGLAASQDEIGNLFLRYPGRRTHLAPVLTGSHLDSQPTGGRFDGAFGVLASLEAIASLARAGIQPARSIEVVAWSNEEGGRFAPGAMGSQIFAGVKPLASVLEVRDATGTLLRDALADTLAALPEATMRPALGGGSSPAAYLEAHIEQGPRLEREGIPVGVVNGIQGCLWVEYEVRGVAGHAGTTPHEYRRDAFEGAVGLIGALRGQCLGRSASCRFTVGRMLLEPNTPNTIPGRVTFTVDFRDADPAAFAELSRVLTEVPSGQASFEVRIRELFRHPPQRFAREIIDVVADSARSHGYQPFELVSGAFHDALFIANVCPSGMIFIRCRGGISHNPQEFADPADTASGAQVLTSALLRLSSS